MKTKTAIFLFAALLSAGGFVSAENAGIDPAPADSAASANAAANNPNKPLDDPPPKPDEPSVADPVGVVSGVVRDRETDFFVRCPGIDLVFQRVFDGEFTASRDLPEGWCHNYEWRIVRTGANQDRAELRALSNPGGVSAFHAFRRGIDGTWGVSDNAPFVLSENADGTWLVKAPGPVLYRFGADGWLDSITARTGETVSVDRGSDRRHVLRVSHACGRSLVFRYGPDGVVSSIRADDGTALEYERIPDREDPSGRVVSWTDEFRRVSAGGDVAAMRYEGRLVPAEAGGGAVIRDVGSFESLAPRQPDSSVQHCKEPIVAKTDENGSVTTYVYRRYMDSPRGRVVFTSTDTAYFVNRFHHETGKTEVTADLGGGNARTSVYEYDPETRRVRSRAVGSRLVAARRSRAPERIGFGHGLVVRPGNGIRFVPQSRPFLRRPRRRSRPGRRVERRMGRRLVASPETDFARGPHFRSRPRRLRPHRHGVRRGGRLAPAPHARAVRRKLAPLFFDERQRRGDRLRL